MKCLTPPFILLLLCCIAGCTSLQHQPTNSTFSFEFENETYEIIGLASDDGESANFLILRDNDSIIFRVIDYNQNGFLNRVITGSIDLDRANTIYQYGIQQAMTLGKFREIEHQREYAFDHEEYRLVIQTFAEGDNYAMNRFIIYDLDWITLGVFWDDDSDGYLNRVDRGEINLNYAQELYEHVLQHASSQNRLDKTFEDQFIISRKHSIRSNEL